MMQCLPSHKAEGGVIYFLLIVRLVLITVQTIYCVFVRVKQVLVSQRKGLLTHMKLLPHLLVYTLKKIA